MQLTQELIETTEKDYDGKNTLFKHVETIKRFNMPDFRPGPAYVREMKRYKITQENMEEDTKIDPYAIDRAYWQSLWYKP